MEYEMKDSKNKPVSGSAFVCSSDEISPHDCRASKIETDANGLTLVFPDGVWLLADNRLNNGRTAGQDGQGRGFAPA